MSIALFLIGYALALFLVSACGIGIVAIWTVWRALWRTPEQSIPKAKVVRK